MMVFPRCEHCGCTLAGTAVYACPACNLHFCESCGLALSVETFTYCPRCTSMKLRATVLAGYIDPGDGAA